MAIPTLTSFVPVPIDTTTPSPTTTTTTTTSLPVHEHELGRRHFFNCGDLTLSWEQEWYTAPFYLEGRSSIDRAASTGAVNPPLEVYQTVGPCQRELGITVESTITTTTNADGVAIWTTQTTVLMTAPPRTTSTSRTSSSRSRSTLSTSTSTTSSSSSRTASISSSSSSTSTSQTSSSASSSTSISSTSTGSTSSRVFASSFSSVPSALALAASSTNSCAGDWDWQAWGMLTNLLFGLLVGAVLWATWAILRGRMPGFFSPRTWFTPTNSRPSSTWSFLAFLFPFLHMPPLSSSAPLSSGALAQRNMWTGLQLAAISSLVALGAALPMFVSGVPCLAETSPRNEQGGRLGTLTDLSLMRLLNALDPSPDSTTTSSFIQYLFTLHGRDLSSTVTPAISSARIRLIVLLVLITVLVVALGLRPMAKGYSKLSKYRKEFNETICGGMSMVFIAAKDAKAWSGKTEERIKIWMRERITEVDEGNIDLSVVGVFAVPDTSDLRERVKDRARILDLLEVAEVKYIQAGRSTPSPSFADRPEPDSKSSRVTGAQIPDLVFHSPTSPTGPTGSPTPAGPSTSAPPTPQVPQTEETGTRFHEINRDSGVFGRRFKIGQRIKVDEQGQYVPASPESSDEGHRMSHEGMLSASTLSSREYDIPEDSVVPTPTPTPSDQTPLSDVVPVDPMPTPAPAPTSARPEEGDTAQVETSRAKATTTPTVPPPLTLNLQRNERHDPDVEAYRTQFKALNEEISILQQDTFSKISRADPMVGWILVGRGVEYLPGAQVIEGRTRKDILWSNLDGPGRSNGEKRYFVQVLLIGFVFFIMTVPFLGLTVSTAPGFASYLPFLKPLAESDGFWAGVVEAFVPAFVLSHLLIAALLAVYRLSRRVRSVSESRQRALAFKASFWFLLFGAVLLPITVVALEYAIQGFATDVQPGRSVGDGAVFMTWFAFVVLLNMAIIVPGLLILQPLRLAKYLFKRRSAYTPRRNFIRRLPPAFIPFLALAPTLIAVFYATSLLILFPLLAIPILLMAYLSFIVVHHQVEYVHAPSTGYEAATLALWTTRRLGWTLCLQPLIYGLILLSRNEWEIGGASVGVAVITHLLAEFLTVGRHPTPSRKKLGSTTNRILDDITKSITRSSGSREPGGTGTGAQSRPTSIGSSQLLRPRQSTSSMLQRLTALLPGLSRLPEDCPLPLPTEDIDDLQSAERASYTRPDLKDEIRTWPDEGLGERGLVYPPELTAEVPIIWLSSGRVGLSGIELNDLASNHGLEAIIDPPKQRSRSESTRKRSGSKTRDKDAEVRSPLMS